MGTRARIICVPSPTSCLPLPVCRHGEFSASTAQWTRPAFGGPVNADDGQCALMLFGTPVGRALLTVSTTLPIWR
jgi:hypothetical protein